MDEWMKTSKYYIPWERYIAMHPEYDDKNAEAMKDRYEEYQNKMFAQVKAFLFKKAQAY